jgi:xylulokinase
MADYPLLIGIDIGTTNCTVVLSDMEGNCKSHASIKIPLICNNEFEAEQNPRDWWLSIVQAAKRCVEQSRCSPLLIKGISVDSHLEAWVCVNEKGKALHNGLLWLDRRTVSLAEEIKHTLDQSMVIKRTGIPVNYVNPAVKVLWLKKNYPEIYKAAKVILSPKDYINYLLTGEVATDSTIASKSMLSIINENRWCEELCSILGINYNLLPPIKWATEALGILRKEAAEELGLPAGIPVAVGAGDDHCQAISCGALTAGDLNIGTGTGSAWKLVTDASHLDFSGTIECHKYIDETKWLLWSGINTTGFSIQWFLENFGFGKVGSWEELDQEASKIDIGCNGLFYYPHLMGARIPRLNPTAKGIFWGITSTHNLKHFYRAILEGVAYNYIVALNIFNNIGANISRVTMVGGETQNKLWNQIKADALGMPIYIPRNSTGSPFGSLLLAGLASGVYSSIKEALDKTLKWDVIVEPRPEATKKYKSIANSYQRIYDHLEPAFANKIV